MSILQDYSHRAITLLTKIEYKETTLTEITMK